VLAPLTPTIHILARGETERADRGVVPHARRGEASACAVRGLLVTSVARTVADLAGTTSLLGGTVVADAALAVGPFAEHPPLVDRAEIVAAARSLPDPAARERAFAVARFADGRSESALESTSRVCMALAGAPPPHLQVPVEDLLGFRARVDFVWPELGLAGEADGASKYRDAALRHGRSPREVLSDQRRREHLIRSSGLRVLRWGWSTGTRPDRMRTLLATAGVPLSRRHTFPGIDHNAIGGGGDG
jgi:hypothetical protein